MFFANWIWYSLFLCHLCWQFIEVVGFLDNCLKRQPLYKGLFALERKWTMLKKNCTVSSKVLRFPNQTAMPSWLWEATFPLHWSRRFSCQIPRNLCVSIFQESVDPKLGGRQMTCECFFMMKHHKRSEQLGGGFNVLCNSPQTLGKMNPIWWAYFSTWVGSPTD